jgi:lipopolysaccharide biosynthesis regulator YciM
MNKLTAQYYCELAELSLKARNYSQAMRMVKQALSADRSCVRASLLEGDICMDTSKYANAVRAYKKVEKQDISLMSETVSRLVDAYERQNKPNELMDYLQYLLKTYDSVDVLQSITLLLKAEKGNDIAIEFIRKQLSKHPTITGLATLLGLMNETQADNNVQSESVIYEVVDKLSADKTAYHCGNCGFNTKNLYWQCPSCNKWDVIRAMNGG